MGNKVNSNAFRLGINTFWKTELITNKYSSLFKESFNLQRLLKIGMRIFNLELISYKVKKQSEYIYLYLQYFSWDLMLRLWKPDEKDEKKGKKIDEKVVNTLKSEMAKRYRNRKVSRYNKKWKKLFFRHLEHILGKKLPFKVKFDHLLKQKRKISQKNPLRSYLRHSIWNLYIKSKQNYRLKFFKFLKDSILAINISLIFVKSEILAYLLGRLIRTHKKVKWIAQQVRKCMASFGYFYLLQLAVRISICGKQKAVGRSRSYSFGFGRGWPMQSPTTRVSYNLNQTWNVFGSFGVKVWIFNNRQNQKKTLNGENFRKIK